MDIVQFIINQIEKPIRMIMYRFNIDKWDCRHCNGTGVCTKGYNDGFGAKYSCSTCIRLDNPEKTSSMIQVSCSVCKGTGRESTYISKQKLKLATKDYKKLET